MTYEELTKKFTELADIVIREWLCIPENLKEKMPLDGWAIISIPVTFVTKSRGEVGAKICINAVGYPLVVVKPKRGQGQDAINIVVSPDQQSYDDFVKKFELALFRKTNIQLEGNLVEGTFTRAYYDMRHAIEDYFKKANKWASVSQFELWREKRGKALMVNSLLNISKICDDSRSTIGPSKTLAQIREIADTAVRHDHFPPIQKDIIITLPPE